MCSKKEQIIQTALHFFAQKGFHATSIQEIADKLGIAKGSVYVYFKSKDDLLFSSMQYAAEQMMQNMLEETNTPELTPRERLKQQVKIHFEKSKEHRDFIIMTLSEKALKSNDQVKQFTFELREKLMQWIYHNILQIYGESIRPYAWDATMIMTAMIKEYIGYTFMYHQLDTEKLADFMIHRLDDITQGMLHRKEEPLITKIEHNEWMKHLINKKSLSPRKLQLESLRQQLANDTEISKQDRELLLSYLLVLEQELDKPKAEPIIVERMISYLETFDLEIVNAFIREIQKQ